MSKPYKFSPQLLSQCTDIDFSTQAVGKSLVYNPQYPQPTVVQKMAAGSATAALSNPPAVGNLLVILCAYYTPSTPIATPTGWTVLAQESQVFGVAAFCKVSAGAADQSTNVPQADATIVYEIENASDTISICVGQGSAAPTAAVNAPAYSLALAAIGTQPGGSGAGTGWNVDGTPANACFQSYPTSTGQSGLQATWSSSASYATVILVVETEGGVALPYRWE